MLVPHLWIDVGSFGPYWGVEESTVSTLAPLMIGTTVSHNIGIPVVGGNPIYSVWAGGTANTPSIPIG